MGNKNARAKKSFDLPNLTLPSSSTADDNFESNVSAATTSPKTPLAFKSFRQGTLMTPNFETLGKVRAKSLSATSPEFVPAFTLKIAPFPKAPRDISCKVPAIEKVQDKPKIADHVQMMGTPRHIYTEVGESKATHKLPMKTEVGVIPINRILQNSTGVFEVNQVASIHPLQEGIHTPSIYSTNTTPEKPVSSNFVTPTKSQETPLSTPSPILPPTGPKPSKPRFVRADKKKKDIIISQTGIIRNLTRVTDHFTDEGEPYKHACANEFAPEVYDVAKVVSEMEVKEREQFWGKNWVEIEVDLRSEEELYGGDVKGDGQKQEQATRDYNTLLGYIDYLGPDFANHVKYIFISILFPSIPIDNSTTTNTPSLTSTSTVSVRETAQTPEYAHLTLLVQKLQPFPSIKRLEIILQTPSNTKKPLSIPQLNLVLPFYDLGFTGWNIKWKTSFMTKAEPVGGWPVHYLDKERNRLLRERERVKNAVFVRKSQFAH